MEIDNEREAELHINRKKEKKKVETKAQSRKKTEKGTGVRERLREWCEDQGGQKGREASDVRTGAAVSYETHVNILLTGGTNY